MQDKAVTAKRKEGRIKTVEDFRLVDHLMFESNKVDTMQNIKGYFLGEPSLESKSRTCSLYISII